MPDSLDKKALYQFIISRYDGYYESVNQKGNFLIALNTLVSGLSTLLMQNIDKFVVNEAGSIVLKVLFALLVIFSFSSLVFILLATRPYWGKKEDLNDSILFFGSVAKKSIAEYRQQLATLDSDAMETDFSMQIHDLARGLESKYVNIRWANDLLLIAVLFFIIMIVVSFSFSS